MRFRLIKAVVAAALMCAMLAFASVASAEDTFKVVESSATNQDGSLTLQADAHPYQLRTSIELESEVNPRTGVRVPPENAKDLVVELPPGFAGNPQAVPTCSLKRLGEGGCSPDSQVGVVALLVGETLHFEYQPIFNVKPPPGVVARFGFDLASLVNVVLDVSVRTGRDYGVTTTVGNLTETDDMIASTVTLWGVPADPSHNRQRCWSIDPLTAECDNFTGEERSQPHVSSAPVRPFLTNPGTCAEALPVTVSVDTWGEPGIFSSLRVPYAAFGGAAVALNGCDRVPFHPSIAASATSRTTDSPTGLNIDLSVPQTETPTSIATSDLRKAVVSLPAGMAVSPSAADGLTACSPEQIGLNNADKPSCPDASKVGSVEIETPLLADPLEGSVYLAQQGNNPFGSLLAIYLVAEGSGVLVKLPGQIAADPTTGQLTTTFDNAPQLPFSVLKLRFFGGPRAALVNPPTCGTYTVSGKLTPWSGGPDVTPSSSFTIDQGCAGSQPFQPGFTAGTAGNQAGGFSPFSLTLTRGDRQQTLGGLTVQMPAGVLGILKSVPLCGEPQASQGKCGAESLIGHTTVGAGAGSNPFYLGGQVYLTGPYKGAPFGLSIVVPALAGPFNLGTVVVRASIAVDPHTARLTVTSDPLPTILEGIPLDLRVVNVTVDRDGFIFNPTDCDALSVNGTVSSSQGASVGVSNHFQAANCAALPFAPKFSASSLAKTSRNGGAALDAKVAYPSGTQANIHSVAVTLPKQLPARLSTIQLACPAATFEANPAACGEGSLVGTATAATPILSTPLTGPAYLVSHGGESFPDIVLVLQSQGIRIDLVGNVFITKTGVTSATFAHVPDAPISGFELNLPMGPHSALSAVGSLCAGTLNMPTTITGQNGAQVKQTTKIKVTGCPKAKKKTKKHKKGKKKHRAKKGSTNNKRK